MNASEARILPDAGHFVRVQCAPVVAGPHAKADVDLGALASADSSGIAHGRLEPRFLIRKNDRAIGGAVIAQAESDDVAMLVDERPATPGRLARSLAGFLRSGVLHGVRTPANRVFCQIRA